MIIDTYKTAIGNFKFGEGAARAVVIVVILGGVLAGLSEHPGPREQTLRGEMTC